MIKKKKLPYSPNVIDLQIISQRIKEEFANSKYRKGAELAGFVFDEPEVLDAPDHFDSVFVRGKFRCVCGREECYLFFISPLDIENELDPILKLHKAGSFSKKHLLKDGYSEYDAERISNIVNGYVKGNN